MSATGAETHRTRGVLFTALGWLVCVAATIALAVAAGNLRGGNADFRVGYVTGRVIGAFLIAFAIGLAIQWGVRKRRTVPVWIGAIAVAVSAVMLLGAAGRASAATADCVPPAKAYGAAPAGWRYTRAASATRARVMRLMKIADIRGTDVTSARGGGHGLVLVAIPGLGDAWIRGFVDAARHDHATVTRTAYGARAIELPGHAARVILGMRGCNAVLADGLDDHAVDTVARAVFG